MLGERIGSEGCVMHLSNPFVFMTSLMSKVQWRYASISVSELTCIKLVAHLGVARRILTFLSTALKNPRLWGGTPCVLREV